MSPKDNKEERRFLLVKVEGQSPQQLIDAVEERLMQLSVMDLSENSLAPQKYNIGEDERFAFKLIYGVWQMQQNGTVTHYQLSARTKPSERDARKALARLLQSPNPPIWLTGAVAALFDPDEISPRHPNQRTVVLKQASKSRARPIVDWIIALRVQVARQFGRSYNQAIADAAEKFGRDARHIERIYARFKDKLVAAPTSDAPTDATASDK